MIGILDSGLGGLSVLREIHAALPNAPFHYIGDSQWCPYGSKSVPQITARVTLLTDYLIAQGAEVIVIACNSATIACVESLRTLYPLPLIGMEPGIKPAARLTQTGVIGVLATEASLSGEKFHRLLAAHSGGLRVLTQSCPRFVELVEAGKLEGEEVLSAVRHYLEPMLAAGADTVVLGCTHYPFLKAVISQLYPQLQIVDTGKAVAKHLEHCYLPSSSHQALPGAKSNFVSKRFVTTGVASHATALLATLCPDFTGQCFESLPILDVQK